MRISYVSEKAVDVTLAACNCDRYGLQRGSLLDGNPTSLPGRDAAYCSVAEARVFTFRRANALLYSASDLFFPCERKHWWKYKKMALLTNGLPFQKMCFISFISLLVVSFWYSNIPFLDNYFSQNYITRALERPIKTTHR